jgi:hypothetical protein
MLAMVKRHSPARPLWFTMWALIALYDVLVFVFDDRLASDLVLAAGAIVLAYNSWRYRKPWDWTWLIGIGLIIAGLVVSALT